MGTDIRALILLPVLAGCPNVHTEPFGNGEQDELSLDHVQRVESLPPGADACAYGRCWMLGLDVGRHTLTIERQVRVHDCGGFGDCLTEVEMRDLQGTPRFVVTPAEAATIDTVQVLDDVVQFDLEVMAPAEFDLAIEIGPWADDWSLRAKATCEPFDCEVYELDASDAPLCCGYASRE